MIEENEKLRRKKINGPLIEEYNNRYDKARNTGDMNSALKYGILVGDLTRAQTADEDIIEAPDGGQVAKINYSTYLDALQQLGKITQETYRREKDAHKPQILDSGVFTGKQKEEERGK